MSDRIGIIANDLEMKRTIEEMYPDEIGSGSLIVEVLDNERINEQGKSLEKKGAKLIIGRGGGYEHNVDNVTVPLLRLKMTSSDIFNALIKAIEYRKRIVLIVWKEIHFDSKWFEFLPVEVEIHQFFHGEDIELIYEKVVKQASEIVIVGGGIVCSLARLDGVDSVFVNTSQESIKNTYEYAKHLLEEVDQSKYQNEILTKTLHGIQDAVIAIDENDCVQLFNGRAQDILKFSVERVLGKKLSETIPELAFVAEDMISKTEKWEELIRLDQSVLTFNTSLIWVGSKVRGMLFMFQDITKLQRLEQKIRRELNKKGLITRYDFSDIVHHDPVMEEMLLKAMKIGRSDSTVVIYGESGTGKEILTQGLHQISKRKQEPFVAINCAALSESLLESELFGYEEGAFTGARKGGKPGLFELAHGGTIFLDEINSISVNLQGKLLRVVEEKEVMRIGSDYVIPLDVRIICAANEDLKAMVREKSFRSDLFYRLSSLELHIPPLRERKQDIIPLFNHFLREIQIDAMIRWPNEDEKNMLIEYDWPGNVRELRNIAERYIMFDAIDLERSIEELSDSFDPDSYINLKDIHHLVDERIIQQLIASGMSKTDIADKLGISRTALWKKTKK
jgi:propionate catabolism operon transcriptional regulator